jgi:hypothetical protein
MNHDSLTNGVRHEPGYVLITAAGEVGIFTVARPRGELFTRAGDGRPVIADLDRVTFPAAGLGALAGAAATPPPAGPACVWPAPGRSSGGRPGPHPAARRHPGRSAPGPCPPPPGPVARPAPAAQPVPAPSGGDDDDDD